MSLSKQTNKNFNVYIGDDASTVCPQKLIAQYGTNLNVKYKRFTTNLGSKSLVKQWYRCLDLIEGEDWVMIVGDDDVLGINVIDAFYQNVSEINEKHINVVRYASQTIDSKGLPTSNIYEHTKIAQSTDFLFENKRSSLSEHLFRRKCFKEIEIKNYPLAWHSDNMMILEMTDFKEIYSINEALVQVRKSRKSISGSSSLNHLKWLASFKFYYHLLVNFNHKFEAKERRIIKERIEKICLNNKGKICWILKVNLIYILRLNLGRFVSFNHSLVRTLLIK